MRWPDTPFRIVLVEPEIPPNTGNIARLCAATGTPLHLVEPLGFRLTEAALRRAGLDYWDAVNLYRHKNMAEFLTEIAPPRMFYFSTKGKMSYLDTAYRPGDALVFGSETRGLPQSLLTTESEFVRRIPIQSDHVRSLNLANAASIVLYEALRQSGQNGTS